MTDHLLLEAALEAFCKETGLALKLLKRKPRLPNATWGDALVRLEH
jgi:hypothetical protein